MVLRVAQIRGIRRPGFIQRDDPFQMWSGLSEISHRPARKTHHPIGEGRCFGIVLPFRDGQRLLGNLSGTDVFRADKQQYALGEPEPDGSIAPKEDTLLARPNSPSTLAYRPFRGRDFDAAEGVKRAPAAAGYITGGIPAYAGAEGSYQCRVRNAALKGRCSSTS